MKYFITCVLMWLSAFPGEAQISMDSLLSSVRSSYTETGKKKYLLESFTIFESADKKDRYDLFLDSLGRLREYIGLAATHYSFDEQNRVMLIEGFDSIGKRSYWDFPVITKYQYVNDTLVPEMNRIRNTIYRSTDSLSDAVISYEMYTGEAARYNKTKVVISSKDGSMKLSFLLGSDGKVRNRKPGLVAYVFREFDTKNKKVIVKEYRYNSDLRLVDGHHAVFTRENVAVSSSSKKYAYSVRELENGEITIIRYYNRKGKLVETSWHRSGPVIDGPVNHSGRK